MFSTETMTCDWMMIFNNMQTSAAIRIWRMVRVRCTKYCWFSIKISTVFALLNVRHRISKPLIVWKCCSSIRFIISPKKCPFSQIHRIWWRFRNGAKTTDTQKLYAQNQHNPNKQCECSCIWQVDTSFNKQTKTTYYITKRSLSVNTIFLFHFSLSLSLFRRLSFEAICYWKTNGQFSMIQMKVSRTLSHTHTHTHAYRRSPAHATETVFFSFASDFYSDVTRTTFNNTTPNCQNIKANKNNRLRRHW